MRLYRCTIRWSTSLARWTTHLHRVGWLPGETRLACITGSSLEVFSSYSGLSRALPCDVNVLALRTLSEPTVYSAQGHRSTKPQSAAAFVLQRLGVECRAQTALLAKCETTDGKVGRSICFFDNANRLGTSEVCV